MEHFNLYVPTRALFGAGELNNLHCQALPGKKALVIISNGRSTRANTSDESHKFAINAKETMSRLFTLDRVQLSDADCVNIYNESYK